MYFEIYRSGFQWRWRLKAANHEILASGESYTSKDACLHCVSLLKQTTVITPVYEVQS
ncbi:YegP family protein [Variovorax sp. R-27]|uniref:YegP family protein n=1 Tax=Variovorax sp. R-27 TaxID=3404058 RepID=UPI003CEF13AE